MFNDGKKNVKLLDIVNLAEEKLSKVIKEIEKVKGNRRIKGLIVYHHGGYDLQLDFRGGKPSLAVMKSEKEEIRGDECWKKISEEMDKVKGVIEVYEVDDEELSMDEEAKPEAVVTSGESRSLEKAEKIDEYSLKLSSTPIIRSLILRDKEQLREDMEVLEGMEDIGEVVKKVLSDSKDKTLYMFITFLEERNWKSFEVIVKNGEVIAAIIHGVNKILTGGRALDEILKLSKVENSGKYVVYLCRLNDKDLELLEKSGEDLKDILYKSSLPKAAPKVEEVGEKPEKIAMTEPIKIDLEKIKVRASNYFKSTLDTHGYSMDDLNVSLIDGVLVFQVKIGRKGFSFKRMKISDVEAKLIDDAQWTIRCLGYNVPVKVNIIQ